MIPRGFKRGSLDGKAKRRSVKRFFGVEIGADRNRRGPPS